jgi:Fe-S oxidoreductase
MSQRKIITLQLAAGVLLAVFCVACSGSGTSYEAVEEAAAEAVQEAAAEPVSETLLAAKLAGADLADGTEDNVVSRCPGCALAMDGSADHALQVKDYELHFCSDSCRHGFEEDTMAKVAKLEIPES